ncbi:class I SAM-dependent RNA methyltransferase [Tropicimonas sp. IMCC34043]|uniref:class I SAM-dependent RNA methyltransferase n=1 Tax=Tropicimonas sp. IMCC34043 TaxID=2248760 RepID=UPI000E21D0D7|nr:RsmD family RNA methyltransferase [Tropicimonas sp. IMCC34043]
MSAKVTIERLGHLGDGIARGPVFVAGALPGEVVSGELDGGRLTAPRIVTPSPDRVSAPCRHYKTCGGCALQHASDAFVAAWKQEVVRTALAAQGLAPPFRAILTSPPQSRRRAVFSGRRTKHGVLVGFHARASGMVVDVPGCLLVDPAIARARPCLEALTRLGASRKGALALTVTVAPEGPDIAVAGGKPADAALRAELAALAEAHGLSRLSWEGEVIALRQRPTVGFDGIAVTPPPGAFLQATGQGEAALRAAAAEAVGNAARIADLFAGCGSFALPLARRAEVHAVEGAGEMVAALDEGWRRASGLKRVTTEVRDLFRRPLLPDELARFDAVVIDPPRAGAEAQMTELARGEVARIAAVSCNPVSFARDAAILVAGGYALHWVQVVDQFRWSPHVELAALFSRDHIPV